MSRKQTRLTVMITMSVVLGTTSLVGAQTAYFSFEGSFLSGTDNESFHFDLPSSVSNVDVFRFETFAHGGGTNAAGYAIAPGGFDPIVELFDNGSVSQGSNDDGNAPGQDALLSWSGVAPNPNPANGYLNSNSLPSGIYRLDLTAFQAGYPGGPSPWALDLVGPSDAGLDITFVTNNGSFSFLQSLRYGTTTSGPGDNATVSLQSGLSMFLTGDLTVGQTGMGTLDIDGGSITATNGRVGFSGFGGMTVDNGGTATFDNLYLSWLGGANSDATVSGGAGASTVTVNGDLEVGDGGVGVLTVKSGGVVDSSGVGPGGRDVIGDDPNSSGVVMVMDANSRWDSDDLVVGDDGTGLLNIFTGGTVTSGDVTVANNAQGTVNIDGLNARWQIGDLTVGADPLGAEGAVKLTNQARVESGNVTIGTNQSNSRVTVDGAAVGFVLRPRWDVTGSIAIGAAGVGNNKLIVENAGIVSVSDSVTLTGFDDVALSALAVRTGGEISIANSLAIGTFGRVDLDDSASRITTGQFTRATFGVLDWTAGTVEITGEVVRIDTLEAHSVFGSALTIGAGKKLIVSYKTALNQSFDVGRSGTGALLVADGGEVESFRGTIGAFNNGTGNAVVRGGGSSWLITEQLRVGQQNSATGQLQIENGGQVTANRIFLGGFDSAHGTVIVDGTGSRLTAVDSLGVGGNVSSGGGGLQAGGTGQLTVKNGGEVYVTNTLGVLPGGLVQLLGSSINTGSFIAQAGSVFDHADGTLTVDGGVFDPGVTDYVLDGDSSTDLAVVSLTSAHATLRTTGGGYVAVGQFNRGRLEILADSDVDLPDGASDLAIGENAGSQGELIVDGAGSSLVTQNGLTVGVLGEGVMRVRNGGSVVSVTGLSSEAVGMAASGVGLVEVIGTTPGGSPSLWATSGELHVGEQAPGTLHILDGGLVHAQAGAGIAMFLITSDGSSALVDGAGPNGPSLWRITGDLNVGGRNGTAGGTGTLALSNGGRVEVSETLKIWQTGTLYMGGGDVIVADEVEVVLPAAINLSGGSGMYVNKLTGFGNSPVFDNLLIGHAAGATAGSHAVGPGQSLTTTGFFTVGVDAPGTLLVTGGGQVESNRSFIGALAGSASSSVILSDPGTHWRINDDLHVGGDGFVTGGGGGLLVSSRATVGVAGELRIWPGSHVELNAGEITAAGVFIDNGALVGIGTVHVSGGQIVDNAGSVRPGLSAGILDIDGIYTQRAAGQLEIELSGAGGVPGVDFDQLAVSQTANLDGALVVVTLSGYTDPAVRGVTHEMSILTAATVNPAFSSMTYDGGSLGHQGGGLFRAVLYNPTSVVLRNLLALEGDTDGDKDVDITDFNTLATNFDPGGASAPNVWTAGNFDGDADIDITDFNALATNFAPGGYDGEVVAAADPGEVDLIVDLATGEIVLEGNAAAISGLQVFSAGSSLLTADFTAEVLQFVISTNPSTYAEGAFVNTQVNGAVSFGVLYDLLVDAKDLTFEYTMIGQPTVQGQVVYVPEPVSLLMMGIGGVLLLRRRVVA